MNSVSKGNNFEETAFNRIQQELENNRLGLIPENVKLFKKKGYYSKDREKDIIVDISLELWLPEAERYSMLWVFECKDYNHNVPVDDVEEFKAKLDQIAGKNVKGTMVVKGSLQEGAYRYAYSNGIGILLLPANRDLRWEVSFVCPITRRHKDWLYLESLTDEQYLELLYESEYDVSLYKHRNPDFVAERVDHQIDIGLVQKDQREWLNNLLDEFYSRDGMFQGQYASALRSQALDMIPSNSGALVQIPIGIFKSREVNARAIRTPRGGAIIALNQAVIAFSKLIYYSFVSFTDWHSHSPYDRRASQIEYADALIAFAKLIMTGKAESCAAASKIWHLAYDNSRGHFPNTAGCGYVIELFILLHEYGHIALNHLNHSDRSFSYIGSEQIEVYETTQLQEFEADEFAVRNVIKYSEGFTEPPSTFALFPGVFFGFLYLCELMFQIETTSHPSALERLKQVMKICGVKETDNLPVNKIQSAYEWIFRHYLSTHNNYRKRS